jgi:hypothetical protein
MCEIFDVMKVKGRVLVECTHCDSDFMNAKSITVFDRINRSFEIKTFTMDHTRQCFNNKPISPWFGIEEDVDENFLQRGNKIQFVYE